MFFFASTVIFQGVFLLITQNRGNESYKGNELIHVRRETSLVTPTSLSARIISTTLVPLEKKTRPTKKKHKKKQSIKHINNNLRSALL